MMQNFRKIELVLGLLIVVLLMLNPVFNPLCRGETETLMTKQLPVMVGDLLFMDNKGPHDFVIGNYNDHVAICREVLEGGEDAEFVEAVSGLEGVKYSKYSDFQQHWENFLIARVKNMQPWQIDVAVAWAESRKGCEYQYVLAPPHFAIKCNDPDDPHPVANKWYCSELVWAAYYNVQENNRIEIDNNGWNCYPILLWPCVSMGCPGDKYIPDWMREYKHFPYFFKNEILIDDDIEVIYKDRVTSGFPAGTKIQKWGGGTVNIENVQAGNVVVTYNIGQDQIAPAIVEAVYYFLPAELTDNFIIVNDDFQVTDNHELFVNGWWMFAEDVQVGDKLLFYSNGDIHNVTVDTLELVTENIGGYALELDSSLGVLASYFADDILVCE